MTNLDLSILFEPREYFRSAINFFIHTINYKEYQKSLYVCIDVNIDILWNYIHFK